MFQSRFRVGVNGMGETLDNEFANLDLPRCYPDPLEIAVNGPQLQFDPNCDSHSC